MYADASREKHKQFLGIFKFCTKTTDRMYKKRFLISKNTFIRHQFDWNTITSKNDFELRIHEERSVKVESVAYQMLGHIYFMKLILRKNCKYWQMFGILCGHFNV